MQQQPLLDLFERPIGPGKLWAMGACQVNAEWVAGPAFNITAAMLPDATAGLSFASLAVGGGLDLLFALDAPLPAAERAIFVNVHPIQSQNLDPFAVTWPIVEAPPDDSTLFVTLPFTAGTQGIGFIVSIVLSLAIFARNVGTP